MAVKASTRHSLIGDIKKRFLSIERTYAQNTNEFLRNTTIHGLTYINRKDLFIVERFYFALAIICVVLICAYYMYHVYIKYLMNPVILSLKPQHTLIIDEPFPAITICNLNQAAKYKVDHFPAFSPEFTMLQMLCKRSVNSTVSAMITDWSILKDFIVNISQPCTSMLLSCRFGGVKFNCTELFHPIVTDEGLCCVFNMLDPRYLYKSHKTNLELNISYPEGHKPVDWHVDTGYPENAPEQPVPFRMLGVGVSLGLSIVLDVDADNYYCSSSNSVGFKVSLHPPNEIPNVREIGLLISPGRETQVRMKMNKFESEERLRTMNKNRRQCIFQDEGNLEVFAHYTAHNCENECVTKIQLFNCGCLAHYAPPVRGNVTTCSINDSKCVENMRLNAVRNTKNINCLDNCWHGCSEMDVAGDFFTTRLPAFGSLATNEILRNMSNSYMLKNIAVINFYMKEYSFRNTKQAEFTGAIDALSSVGGLICIFFGFSFISLTEFVFYAMIRPCHRVRNNEHEDKKQLVSKGNPYPALAPRKRYYFKNPFKYSEYAMPQETSAVWSKGNSLYQSLLNAANKRQQQAEVLRRWQEIRQQ